MNDKAAIYRAWGSYFGYPACCVEAFIQDTDKSVRGIRNPFYGKGFVPCATCAEEARKDIDKFYNEKIAPNRHALSHLLK